jgi:YfiH family protein
MSKERLKVIDAQWTAPRRVHAFTTTRAGGVSVGDFAQLNLADHVGDDSDRVEENRQRLVSLCNLPSEPLWLEQVHGTRVVNATTTATHVRADSSYADGPGVVCAVLTADCVPVFLCNRLGDRIGIIHVGWRGLAAGVVEKALEQLGMTRSDVLAWLGPAIGPRAFEIGEDVKSALHDGYPGFESCFTKAPEAHKWMANLYALVCRRLHYSGIDNCHYDESLCTFSQPDRFFSYRRDRDCGRMASVIWIDP